MRASATRCLSESVAEDVPIASPRTLLIVSGGPQTVPVIEEARRLGIRVVVSDGAPDAPGFRLADAGLPASTGDPEATVEAVQAYAARTPVDGVLAGAANVLQTVAAVTQALGLGGVSIETAHLITDRLAMLDRLAAGGVPVPWHAAVASSRELERLARRADRALVAKPVDARSARAVVRLLRGVDPSWAFEVALAGSLRGSVMVEEFFPGAQVKAATVVVGGRTTTVALADCRYDSLDSCAPFIVEQGSDLPSRLSPAVVERVTELVASAAAALGVQHGAVQTELVVDSRGPVLLDLITHLAGGHFWSHEIPLSTGVNLVAEAIHLALGDTPDAGALRPRWSGGVARRRFFLTAGTVVAVEGAAEVAWREGIALLDVTVGPGTRAPGTTSRMHPAGTVIAVGDTREQAVARAEAAVACVRIVTEAAGPADATLH
ncbi:MAG TPA: hypothetical protein VE911_10555 [Candidatus Nitrosopolaris sp.]|nr:hypothetical protein [Candidatus Nitrosopolaris sp.]